MALDSHFSIRLDASDREALNEAAERHQRKPRDLARLWLRAAILQDQLINQSKDKANG